MPDSCTVLNTDSEEACIQGTPGTWTWHTRAVRTLWCIDSVSGQGYERKEYDPWVDTKTPCIGTAWQPEGSPS